MKELANLLNNHRLEVESLKDQIDDLQAHKELSIYLVNKVGFDSVASICDYVSTGKNIENDVIRKLLHSRWSNRDRPMDIVIQELIEEKEGDK